MEEKTTKDMLNDEIRSQIDGLRSLPIGSKELGEAVDNVATLYKLRIEEERMEADIDDKLEKKHLEEKKHVHEQAYHYTQLAEAKKDRFIRIVTSAAEIGVPTILMLVTLNFEKTGTICSSVGRKMLNQIRFKK